MITTDETVHALDRPIPDISLTAVQDQLGHRFPNRTIADQRETLRRPRLQLLEVDPSATSIHSQRDRRSCLPTNLNRHLWLPLTLDIHNSCTPASEAAPRK